MYGLKQREHQFLHDLSRNVAAGKSATVKVICVEPPPTTDRMIVDE
jgi:hypothetical protein